MAAADAGSLAEDLGRLRERERPVLPAFAFPQAMNHTSPGRAFVDP